MSRNIFIRVVALVLIAGTAVAAYWWLRSDERPTTVRPGADALLGPQARELASLVARGSRATYHAVYERRGEGVSRGDVRIEVWRRGSLVRSDETVRMENDVVRTASFRLEDETVVCVRRDERPWKCRGSRIDADAPDPVLGRIADELSDKQVRASDERVDGRRARCYEIARGAEAAEVCLTPAGIPAAYRIEDARLELVELETGAGSVDAAVFRPPSS